MRFQCKFRCGGRKLSWKRLWAALGVDLERRRVSGLGPPALGSKQLTPCPALPGPRRLQWRQHQESQGGMCASEGGNRLGFYQDVGPKGTSFRRTSQLKIANKQTFPGVRVPAPRRKGGGRCLRATWGCGPDTAPSQAVAGDRSLQGPAGTGPQDAQVPTASLTPAALPVCSSRPLGEAGKGGVCRESCFTGEERTPRSGCSRCQLLGHKIRVQSCGEEHGQPRAEWTHRRPPQL